jgi:glycosyltransferase involved in cell wall biosynthesis
MKIDILAGEGSPCGVTEQSIYGIDGRPGVGGAELGILTLCRLWHDAGHDVTLYNNPEGGGSAFKQRHIRDFRPHEDRDAVIVFRSPNYDIRNAKGRKIWYSNDQYTTGDYKPFAEAVEKIVVISELHKKYFEDVYGIYNTVVIDIPIRTGEYPKTEKKKNSCIYASVPDRGLINLPPIWKHIVDRVPDATLTVLGDWSLWNGRDFTQEVAPYRAAFAGRTGVIYKSAVKREELLREQLSAEFHLYPCTYQELFCISVAESQVAGAFPVTSRVGALETTNRFGVKVDGDPSSHDFRMRFADMVVELMRSGCNDIADKAKEEFSNEKVLAEWDKILNG